MARKEIVTLSMPASAHAAYERFAADIGGKAKWVVIAAGIVALAELTDEQRQAYFGRVLAADISEQGMDRLLEDAGTGDLRRSIDHDIHQRSERSPLSGKPPIPLKEGGKHLRIRSLDHRGMEAAKTDPDAPRRPKR